MAVICTLYVALAFVVLFVSTADCKPIIKDGVVYQSLPNLFCEEELKDVSDDGIVDTVRCRESYYFIEGSKTQNGRSITVTYDNSSDPSVIPRVETICEVESVPVDEQVACIGADMRPGYTLSWNYIDASGKPEFTGANSYEVKIWCEAREDCPVKS